MESIDLPVLPLLGHGGLLDALGHALTRIDASLGRTQRNTVGAERLEAAREALEEADAALKLAREALWAEATIEQTVPADPSRRTASQAHWIVRHESGNLSDAERTVLNSVEQRCRRPGDGW
jgi:hypothetical protein